MSVVFLSYKTRSQPLVTKKGLSTHARPPYRDRTFVSVQISLCPVEHGDGFEASHRASWSPGVQHIASGNVTVELQ